MIRKYNIKCPTKEININSLDDIKEIDNDTKYIIKTNEIFNNSISILIFMPKNNEENNVFILHNDECKLNNKLCVYVKNYDAYKNIKINIPFIDNIFYNEYTNGDEILKSINTIKNDKDIISTVINNKNNILNSKLIRNFINSIKEGRE